MHTWTYKVQMGRHLLRWCAGSGTATLMSTLCRCCWRRMGWTMRPPAQGTPCLSCGAPPRVRASSVLCPDAHSHQSLACARVCAQGRLFCLAHILCRSCAHTDASCSYKKEREPCGSCTMHCHDLSLFCLSLRAACACHTALQALACVMHDLVCGECAGNHNGKHPRTYGPRSVTIPVFQYLRQGFGENRVECTNSLASACASPACPPVSRYRTRMQACMALVCASHGRCDCFGNH